MRQHRKRSLAGLAVAVTAAALIGVGTQPAAAAPTAVVIDPGVRSQPFVGWGTSLAWSANYTGNWPNREEMADRLFGTANTTSNPSLMLNIVRYNIGGGNDPQYVSSMRTGAAVPGYKPTATGPYDWTADANQRWWLAAAKSRIPASQFVADAVSYSAPYWMTQSGQSTGATSGGNNNLQVGKEAEFADYLTTVVKHFRDTQGVTFRTLAPINEPATNYWQAGGKQEGMHVSPGADQARILNAVYDKLVAKGLPTKLAASDETGIDDAAASIRALASSGFDLQRLGQVNTHTYKAGDSAGLRELVTGVTRLPLSMSEVTTTAGSHNHASIAAALGLSTQLSGDLNVLQPNEWVYWQALESEKESIEGNGNWGLMHYTSDGSKTYTITKKFHVMRQYTNFIRPGSRILHSSNAGTVAAYDPATGKLSIVVANTATTASDFAFDLSRFGTVGSAEVYRTSSTEDRATIAGVAPQGKSLNVRLAPQSVTTFVVPVSGGMDAAVQNANFSVGASGQHIPGWNSWGGDAFGTHLDADYTQAGGKTPGGLEGVHYRTVPYTVYTSQNVKVPNGTYTLSAWVRSSGGQTTAALVAKNYGGSEKRAAIPAGSSYTQISIPNVQVTNGQVEIGFYSMAGANQWIAFDEVTLQ